MVNYIEEVELLAVRESTYTMYVFKIINTGKFIMCTRLPNWQTPDIIVGDVGFLNYQQVSAGEKYYDVYTEEEKTYRYSNIYYVNFVKKSEISKDSIII